MPPASEASGPKTPRSRCSCSSLAGSLRQERRSELSASRWLWKVCARVARRRRRLLQERRRRAHRATGIGGLDLLWSSHAPDLGDRWWLGVTRPPAGSIVDGLPGPGGRFAMERNDFRWPARDGPGTGHCLALLGPGLVDLALGRAGRLATAMTALFRPVETHTGGGGRACLRTKPWRPWPAAPPALRSLHRGGSSVIAQQCPTSGGLSWPATASGCVAVVARSPARQPG